jgi:hypothetical protein
MDWRVYGNETLKGWKDLIHPLIDLCESEGVTITQIKEKFGGLRFYVGAASEAVHKAIEEAEKKADLTCEECGEPGVKCCPKYWIRTLCEKHAEEYERQS